MTFNKVNLMKEEKQVDLETDYRGLLKKYIAHVTSCESVNYIDEPWSDIRLTENEKVILRELANEQ